MQTTVKFNVLSEMMLNIKWKTENPVLDETEMIFENDVLQKRCSCPVAQISSSFNHHCRSL